MINKEVRGSYGIVVWKSIRKEWEVVSHYMVLNDWKWAKSSFLEEYMVL